MQVPFIDLQRLVDQIKTDVLADWQGALDRCEFVGGPSVTNLEKNLAKTLAVTSFTACSNGTDALMVALRALGVGPHMRVAVPNMTFWAPYEAVVLAGAEPVLVDMDPEDLQMSFAAFKEAHDRCRFDAAILVHLFGWSSQHLYDFRDYCKRQDIMLVEDGAQCFGALYQGEPVLAGAHIGTMSFYPAKVLGSCGDAGGITTCDIKLAEKITSLANHGRAGHYTYDYVGYNARSGALQAQFLSRVLAKFPEVLASRQKAHQFYQDFFSNHKDLCTVHLPPAACTTNGYLNVMTAPGRRGDDIVGALARLGVGAARTYPQTLDRQPPARQALKASDLKVSQDFCDQVFNLPLFAGITEDECQYAAESLVKVLKASPKP